MLVGVFTDSVDVLAIIKDGTREAPAPRFQASWVVRCTAMVAELELATGVHVRVLQVFVQELVEDEFFGYG